MRRYQSVGRRTYLASSVNDVAFIFDTIMGDRLRERRLDGRIIGLLEMVFYELYDQRRLPCSGCQCAIRVTL